jgi:hypothetical protein
MKWSFPVNAVRRLEYLPKLNSEMFIFKTPSHIFKNETETAVSHVNSGEPVVVFSGPAGGLNPDIGTIN